MFQVGLRVRRCPGFRLRFAWAPSFPPPAKSPCTNLRRNPGQRHTTRAPSGNIATVSRRSTRGLPAAGFERANMSREIGKTSVFALLLLLSCCTAGNGSEQDGTGERERGKEPPALRGKGGVHASPIAGSWYPKDPEALRRLLEGDSGEGPRARSGRDGPPDRRRGPSCRVRLLRVHGGPCLQMDPAEKAETHPDDRPEPLRHLPGRLVRRL